MTLKPDSAEALNGGRVAAGEGAPEGAPERTTGQVGPRPPVPTGAPEAPVTPPTTTTHADAEPAEADHERQLEHDLDELAAKAGKADEYLQLAQRTRADFENYRKRATRDAAAAQERGIAKLAKELLPAVDNLDRALDAAAATGDGPSPDNGTATLVSGIKLVHEDVIAALARAGIERFSPQGERFDPQLHEAVAQQPVDGAESGTVVEVYQRGYRLGEVVIRPARVVVAA
jgi:molecular chaperone GrpE